MRRNKVDPSYLISLLQEQPAVFRLDGPSKLKFITNLAEREKRLTFIDDMLSAFDDHKIK
ncbi:hypothetical protein AB8849_11410 [Proteus vulgaris]